MINHERGKREGILTTTNETYTWSSVTVIFSKGKPGHDGARADFNIATRKTWFYNFLVSKLQAMTADPMFGTANSLIKT